MQKKTETKTMTTTEAKVVAKAPAKKTAAKTPAKKTAEKAPAKKTAATTKVMLQFQNQEVDVAKIEEKIKAQFVAEGHRLSAVKSLDIYVKPEEYKAYYVINDGKYTGGIDLF